MFIKENILLAIAGIKSNKMRSLLTMLGIIIGISSVIAIVSIGSAITSSVTKTMGEMGASNIEIGITEKTEDGQGNMYSRSTKKPEDNDLISTEQINSLKETFSDRVSNIALTERKEQGKIKDGYLYANVSITGVNDGYKDVRNVKMINGRFISDKDLKGSRKSAVVSDKLVANMFKGVGDPLGKEIKFYAQDTVETYVIVGIYKYEASPFGGDGGMTSSEKDRQTNLYIPVTTAKASQKNKNYSYLTVKPNNNVDSEKLVKDMEKYLEKLYKNNKNWTTYVYSAKSEVESFTSALQMISLAISVIAAISLLVGGIGVMNIMLVSVTERTREIGTRKALGAKSSYIKMQFITESIIICAIGGIIGITLGIGFGVIACILLKAPIAISISTILISFTFSMAIGVFFGYYPAKKAASLDPIEALRYE
ncbi:ABC transporter permease [Clostridium uliginosum]|uniref:Putative ABC transport system permease protein n=1 Tax=Clostridium uliginosum TaxID=119641 RepID=A0A1I1IXW0_9CLOT|nr:ABC transporter permease [Clostridium uliginosum]SFC41127.1 putative ABC transport system permease protein [Clostridium uliginosum]